MKTIIIIFLSFLIFSCTEDKDTIKEENSNKIELEKEIKAILDSVETDTDFTLKVRSENGSTFEYSRGSSNSKIFYESASTSKLVSATIILDLVKKGVLSLDDNPQKYISFWPKTGNLSKITLQSLLSFTSGLKNEALCINSKTYDFSKCVENIINKNTDASLPGLEFNYGSSHLQVAGLMAINAKAVNSWAEIFDEFKTENNLFKESKYDLPSKSNPRLAGGMHWNADEYLEFLAKIYKKDLLNEELLNEMFSDQLKQATLVNSPAEAINEDWHYGFGNWIECHSESFNCTKTTRVSSPGLYGAYPFIDFEYKYYGILARKGAKNTFSEGYSIFIKVSEKLQVWANLK